MSGSSLQSCICLDGVSPLTLSAQTKSAQTKSALLKHLMEIEMDPTNQAAWLEGVDAAGADSTLLDVYRSTLKKQTGSFVDDVISTNTLFAMIAPPQCGKTMGMWLAMLEAAYDRRMLSLLMCTNSCMEIPRFKETVLTINGVITHVAQQLGMSIEETPQLKLFSHETALQYEGAVSDWANHLGSVIPVFVIMANDKKMDHFHTEGFDSFAHACGFDEKGRVKGLLVVDEADQAFKTDCNESQLERSLFSVPVVIGDRGFPNLFSACSSIILVTSTPQAIVCGDIKYEERKAVVLEQKPSSENWQFHKKDGWANKVIDCVEATDYDEMIVNMCDDSGNNRFALVWESKDQTVSGRSASALEAAKKYKEHTSFASMSWSSGKVDLFTSDPYIVSAMRSAPAGTFTEDNYDGVTGFTGCKSINSYPALLQFLQRQGEPETAFSFVLFAKEMTDRAIPVKGLGHEWPLTDMWIKAPKIHQEARLQVCGRLCGIDPLGDKKTLWASKVEHDLLFKAIATVDYIVSDLLKNGVGALDAMGQTQKAIYDLTGDGVTVVDDVHNAISRMGVKGLTRPQAGKRARDMASDTKKEAALKKVKISSSADVSVSSLSSPVVEDLSKIMEMEEACGEGVVKAILEVVVENGGSVTLASAATDVASRASYPDGTSFSPTAFLKFIASRKGSLLATIGITFANVPNPTFLL